MRRKNFLAAGKHTILGYPITKSNGDLHRCLREVEQALHATEKPCDDDDYLYGRGIAAFMKSPSMTIPTSSGALLKCAGDGSVTISIGGIEMGQGVHMVLAQIAAEALKIPVERIHFSTVVDTRFSPPEWQTVASITTFRAGNAVVQACERAIETILRNASVLLKRPVNDLVYHGDCVTSKSDPGLCQPVKPLLVSSMGARGPVTGEELVTTGTFVYNGTIPPGAGPELKREHYHVTFGCQGAEVKIHRPSGTVTVTHLVTAIDLGRVINPELARCQVVGSMVMAMGSALTEEVLIDERGAILNPDLNRYHIPEFQDMPEKLSVIFVETPEEDGPYGARCIGEHPTVGIPPAILNALHDALGVDFYHIPVRPGDMCAALKERGSTR